MSSKGSLEYGLLFGKKCQQRELYRFLIMCQLSISQSLTVFSKMQYRSDQTLTEADEVASNI